MECQDLVEDELFHNLMCAAVRGCVCCYGGIDTFFEVHAELLPWSVKRTYWPVLVLPFVRITEVFSVLTFATPVFIEKFPRGKIIEGITNVCSALQLLFANSLSIVYTDQ